MSCQIPRGEDEKRRQKYIVLSWYIVLPIQISLVLFMPNITTNHAISYTYLCYKSHIKIKTAIKKISFDLYSIFECM